MNADQGGVRRDRWGAGRPRSIEEETITARHRAWAAARGLPLDEGGGALARLDHALFTPLDDTTRAQFADGAGGELERMTSLRSSSALAVNVFLPWKGNPLGVARHLGAVGECRRLSFEERYPTGVRGTPPHLDVVFEATSAPIAVESKFLEPYDKPKPQSLSHNYLAKPELWAGLPALRVLAEAIAAGGAVYERLDAAQLVKHVLGLSRRYGASGFRLVYLWYRVPGPTSDTIAGEIERFGEVVGGEVDFVALTHQDLFLRLSATPEPMPGYLEHLAARYFPDRI